MNPTPISARRCLPTVLRINSILNRAKLFAVLLSFGLAGGAPTPGAVLVYQFRASGKVITGGTEYRYSTRGNIVWDLEGHHLTWVSHAVSGGTRIYRVTAGTPVVVSLTGRGGKRHTTFSGAASENGRYFQDFNRGRAVTLRYRTGQTLEFPRTFKGLSHSLSTSLPSRLDDNSHTLVYSPARTVAANDAGKTAGEVIADLTAQLEADGYTEAPSAVAASTFTTSAVMDSFTLPISINVTNTP